MITDGKLSDADGDYEFTLGRSQSESPDVQEREA